MKRREFIALFGSAIAAWPLAAHAQKSVGMRRIGVLMLQDEDDPSAKPRIDALGQELEKLNWAANRNIQIDIRWGAADAKRSRKYAAEVIALAPDVIVATASAATAALQEATSTVPIVFVNVTDPVGAGYVAGLARPGGNITGFITFEYGMSGKWLESKRNLSKLVV